MAIILGFLSIPSLHLHADGEVCPIGELTPISKTFHPDPLVYSAEQADLHVFSRTNLTIGQAEQLTFDAVMSDVAEKLANLVDLPTAPGATLLDKVTTLLEEDNWLDVVSIGSGILYPLSGGVNWPSSINFRYVRAGESPVWQFTVWLNDVPTFRDNYLPMTYHVVSSVDDPDRFFTAFNAIKLEAATNRNPTILIARANAALEEMATTGSVVLDVTVNSPDGLSSVQVSFYVAYNGRAGYDQDDAYSAIYAWLVDNSSYTEEQWQTLITELAPQNSYYIIPHWWNKAIVSPGVASALLSSSIPASDETVDARITKFFSSMLDDADSEVEINNYDTAKALMTYAVASWKGAGFYALGDKLNPAGWVSFKSAFSDYRTIASNSIEITQLTVKTRNFIYDLEAALLLADSYISGGSPLPAPYVIESFNGYRYVKKATGGTVVKVLTRESYEANP